MAYQAIDVANYIVKRSLECENYINNLHLQKSLYFLQAYFIVEESGPLFEDDIEMWRLGPVVTSVYHEYKLFGSSNISHVLNTPVFNYETLKIEYKNEDNITLKTDTKLLLDPLIDSLFKKDAFYLVDLCLKQDLFQKHKEDIYNSKGESKKYIYNIDEMYEYFNDLQNYTELIVDIFEIPMNLD